MRRKLLIILALLNFTLSGATAQYSIINKTLSYEGEKLYKNSKRGIEYATLKQYNKKYGTNWKLSSLTHEQAVLILQRMYWNDRLNYISNDKIVQFIFDFQMNTNSVKSYRLMHKALGLKEQSTLSLELVDKINSSNPKIVLKKLYNTRLNYLKSLKSWKVHSNGWMARLDDLVK